MSHIVHVLVSSNDFFHQFEKNLQLLGQYHRKEEPKKHCTLVQTIFMSYGIEHQIFITNYL